MRTYLRDYTLVAPRSLDEALALLASGEGWRPFAGGTDLMVVADAGKLPWKRFVSIWGLDELRGIAEEEGHIALGALTTYAEVQRHPLLAAELPLLGQAAAETGGIAIQNRGTLGGNVANASPAADTPPALLVYDAELELVSVRGRRRVPYASFHQAYKKMDLAPDELVARILLPRRRVAAAAAADGWRDGYRKVGTRKAQAISKLCLATSLRLDGDRVADVRIALGAVAPVPLRCVRTEDAVRGGTPGPDLAATACAALEAEIAPIDDFRSNAAYRRRVAGNLLAAALGG